MIRLICGVTAAMVGAGFASGREIMQFFTRFGSWSWLMIAVSSVATALLTRRLMDAASGNGFLPDGKKARAGKAALLLLFLCTAGAMTAAAGELTALTIPLIHARSLGMAVTLMLCFLLSRRSISALKRLGMLLIPLMTAAWLLCMGGQTDDLQLEPISKGQLLPGLFFSVLYSAMNVMLSSGVLYEVGACCESRKRTGVSVGVGCVTAALLSLGNLALLPRRAQWMRRALPTVALLRKYGKAGFYLSAGVLYLAAVTTLIAVLRSLNGIWPKQWIRYRKASVLFSVFLASLLGFGEIVALLYPAAGALSLLLILYPQKKRRPSPAPGQIKDHESRSIS